MSSEVDKKEKCGNDANRMLAVVLIALIWVAMIMLGTLLAFMFEGEAFLIRNLITLPFAFAAVSASNIVWKHYR